MHERRPLQRPPFQFRLWHLFWLMSVIAGLLALGRLDIVDSGRIVFVGAELVVVVVGTAGLVHRVLHQRFSSVVLRGALGGACLAEICFGWIFLVSFLLMPRPQALAMMVVLAMLGGLVGLVVASMMFCLRHWFVE